MKKKNNEKLTKSKFIIKETIKYLKNYLFTKTQKLFCHGQILRIFLRKRYIKLE